MDDYNNRNVVFDKFGKVIGFKTSTGYHLSKKSYEYSYAPDTTAYTRRAEISYARDRAIIGSENSRRAALTSKYAAASTSRMGRIAVENIDRNVFGASIYDVTLGPNKLAEFKARFIGVLDETISDPLGRAVGAKCFPHNTLIGLASGDYEFISNIVPGDEVLAFDPSVNNGVGALVPRRVKRVFRNTTTEWIKLSWSENGDTKELVTTPGHHFLDQFGGFPSIETMIAGGSATVVLASGELAKVMAKRIIYSTETAHMFEQARAVGMVAGNAALQPVTIDAWHTYNFEVEELHTYIAGGVRVHNISDARAHDEIGIDDYTPFGIPVGVAYNVPGFGHVSIDGKALNDHYDAMGGIKGYAGTATGWGLMGAFAAQDSYQNVGLSAGVFSVGYAEVAERSRDYSPEYAHWAKTTVRSYLKAEEPYSATREGWAVSLGPSEHGYPTGSAMHVASKSWSAGGGFVGAYAANTPTSVSMYSDEAYAAYHAHLDAMYDSNPYARSVGTSTRAAAARERAAQAETVSSKKGVEATPTSGSKGITGAIGGFFSAIGGLFSSSGSDSGGGSGKGPVLFDLDGDGISITERDNSTHYFNLGDDGYDHRTAWAGVGDGVLVIDADGDGKISSKKEVVFTDWDPSADSDMEALRQVFDTNGNGLLDAGDAEWGAFHIMVTQSDGSTVMKTLSELGIESLTLDADETRYDFADGSSIDGETVFTRTDGSTGTAATATVMVDLEGFAVTKEQSTDVSGQRVIVTTALDADGSLGSKSTRTTSVDGLIVTTEFDHDGDGVTDRVLSEVTEALAGGGKRVSETDRTGAGVLISTKVTETSADGATITISRDDLGGGYVTQLETQVTATDGSLTTTVSDKAADGSTISSTQTSFSADRAVRRDRLDRDGNGAYERAAVSQTIDNADGSQTKTDRMEGGDGTLLSQTIVDISASGLTRTETVDLDGDGLTDRQSTSATVRSAVDGSSTVTEDMTARDGSGLGQTVTQVSADGLSKLVASDVDGDGIADRTISDVTVVAADESRTQTVIKTSSIGSVLSRTVTTRAVDGLTGSKTIDANGDGITDQTTTVIKDAADQIIETGLKFSRDGTVLSRQITTTSADGLSTTVEIDSDGQGGLEEVQSVTKVQNADGSATQTVERRSGDGTLLERTVSNVSADGLVQQTTQDVDGDGTVDKRQSSVTVVNSDDSQIKTVEIRSGDATLLSRQVTSISDDRRLVETTIDQDGDGDVDSSQTVQIQIDGSRLTDERTLDSSGQIISQKLTNTSANGLVVEISEDHDGDGQIDARATSTTVLTMDGGQTVTKQVLSGDSTLQSSEVVETSGNGLSEVTSTDQDGDGDVDVTSASQATLNVDGSTSTTETVHAGTSLTSSIFTVTSGNGLQSSVSSDIDGDGDIDRLVETARHIPADGSSLETRTVKAGDGSLVSSETVSKSSDQLQSINNTDRDGDGVTDFRRVSLVLADGSVETTTSELDSGTLLSSMVETVSADGLTKTLALDLNGDGSVDQTKTEITAIATDGSSSIISSVFAGSGVLEERTTTFTSGDGLSKSVIWADGGGATLRSFEETTVLSQDGGSIVTSTYRKADGSLESSQTVTQSGDGNSVTTNLDIDGNGNQDQLVNESLDSDGVRTVTYSQFGADGATLSARKTVTTLSLIHI